MIFVVLVAAAAEVQVVVVDADGEPLPGAVVRWGDVDLPTDRKGRTVLDITSEAEVLVLAPGYAPTEHRVRPGRRVRILRLHDADAAVEVVVEAAQRTAHPTRHAIDAEKAEETPGALDDAVRLVQSLPSVTVQREYSPTSGDLSVRGSAPGDSRYFLDGIEIPYLYHFNQYASVFPTSQIGTLELLPSTFSAAFGDAVGAVVDARSRLEVPERAHGSAHLNFVMFGGDVRAPVSDRAWVSASGRRSYQDLGGEATPQYPVWPVFHDAVVRFETGDATEGTGAFVMSAGDAYERAVDELDVVDPLEADGAATVTYAEAFQVYGVHHRFLARRSRGRLVVAAVSHGRQGSLSDLGSEDLRTWTGVLRADLEGTPGEAVAWDAGLELRASDHQLEVIPGGPQAARVGEEVPALARGQAIDAQLRRRQLGTYGTAYLTAGPLQLMPGLRVDLDDAGGGPQLGPRLAARLGATDTTVIDLAGGRYSQRPDADLLMADPLLPTTTSWQASAGVEQTLAGRVEVGLDSYLKWLEHPLFVPLGEPVVIGSEGRAAGVELTARYRLRERFFAAGWMGLQRADVLLNTEDGPLRVPADADQRLSAGVVASWDVGSSNLGVRYRASTGLPYTPLEGSLFDAGQDAWIPTAGTPNGARLPAYHKLDLRAATTWTFRGGSLTASAELWIVPARSAQLYPTWSYDYRQQGWVQGPTVLPLLGLKARF